MMNRKSFWPKYLLFFTFLLTGQIASAQDIIPLTPAQPQEQMLTGTSPLKLRISLQQGQFMRAYASQNSADLMLELWDANNKSLLQRNLTTFPWDEALAAEAPADGDYFLTVRSRFPVQVPIKVSLRLDVVPRVTNKEQALLNADQLLQQAQSAFSFQPGMISRKQIEEAQTTAFKNWQQAVTLYQLAGDRFWEGYTLMRLCTGAGNLEQREQAIKYGEQALLIWRERNDRVREADTLNNIGLAIFDVNKINSPQAAKQAEIFAPQSIPWHEQALAIRKELNDPRGIADSLMRLGESYAGTPQRDKRFAYFEQAFGIYQELKNIAGQRLALMRLGNSYRYEKQLDKAVSYYEEAVKISEAAKINDYVNVNLLIEIYVTLENYDKAIQYTEKLLTLGRLRGDKAMEAAAIRFMSENYREKKMYAQALEYAEKGLAFAQTNNVNYAEGSLTSFRGTLAHIYLDMGQAVKAIDLLKQVLAEIQNIKDPRFSPADYYWSLGKAYRLNQQPDLALQQFQLTIQDLLRMREIPTLASVYGDIMIALQMQQKTEAAIFWGKQAINLNQDVRRSITGLDEKTRKGFLKAREETYRNLADLLLSLGRLPEAEQVIRMLKEEEYYEYVRRDDKSTPSTDKTALTPEEAAMEKRFREITESLIELGEQRSTLLAKSARSAEENIQLSKLESDLSLANQKFQQFLAVASTELGKKPTAQQTVAQLREVQSVKEELRALGKDVAALYTLVGAEKFRIILTNANVQKAYEVPIKGTELNRKVLALRDALQNKQSDPRPAAQELYQILIGPIAKDLNKMNAKTLMWSLDGVLRYVPVAALYDGERYLIERYDNVVFTPASNSRWQDAPRAKWQALGLGVTRGFENTPPLPAVAEEMRSIIKDEAVPDSHGILLGTIKLDDQFTQASMFAALRTRPAVVHVASHFQFKPGNETNSALLLGDGKLLSLAQIKATPDIFAGVELLTLSACNTATGSSTATGKEIEGFGVLAQRQGAKAVVASLWPVDDRTTRLLMEEFYRGRETGKLSKGEALRQAQIRLLRGQLKKTSVMTSSNAALESAVASLPTKRPFQHPYYWAPFILIGNWR